MAKRNSPTYKCPLCGRRVKPGHKKSGIVVPCVDTLDIASSADMRNAKNGGLSVSRAELEVKHS